MFFKIFDYIKGYIFKGIFKMKIKLLALMTTLAVSMSVSLANENKIEDDKSKNVGTVSVNTERQNDGAVLVDTTPEDKKGEVFQSYAEFLKKNPKAAEYNKTPEILLGSKVDAKKLRDVGYFLDTDFNKSDKFSFYRFIKPAPKFDGIDVTEKVIIVSNESNKVQGFLIRFSGEENFDKFDKLFNKKLGDKQAFQQRNVDLFSTWGFVDKNSKNVPVHPVVLTYNIYLNEGNVLWGSPEEFFK